MKTLSPSLAALALLPLVLPLQGCLLAAAAAGAGAAYVYTSSQTAEVEADPERVIAAAEGVMAEMSLEVESSAATAIDGRLLARTASDEQVRVTVSSADEGRSKVTVRVGIADEGAAERILRAIQDRL